MYVCMYVLFKLQPAWCKVSRNLAGGHTESTLHYLQHFHHPHHHPGLKLKFVDIEVLAWLFFWMFGFLRYHGGGLHSTLKSYTFCKAYSRQNVTTFRSNSVILTKFFFPDSMEGALKLVTTWPSYWEIKQSLQIHNFLIILLEVSWKVIKYVIWY